MALINDINIDGIEHFELFTIGYERDINFSIVIPLKIQKYRISLLYESSFISNFIIGEQYTIRCNSLFKYYISQSASFPKYSQICHVINNLGENLAFKIQEDQDYQTLTVNTNGIVLYRPSFDVVLINYSYINNIKKMIFEEI